MSTKFWKTSQYQIYLHSTHGFQKVVSFPETGGDKWGDLKFMSTRKPTSLKSAQSVIHESVPPLPSNGSTHKYSRCTKYGSNVS